MDLVCFRITLPPQYNWVSAQTRMVEWHEHCYPYFLNIDLLYILSKPWKFNFPQQFFHYIYVEYFWSIKQTTCESYCCSLFNIERLLFQADGGSREMQFLPTVCSGMKCQGYLFCETVLTWQGVTTDWSLPLKSWSLVGSRFWLRNKFISKYQSLHLQLFHSHTT